MSVYRLISDKKLHWENKSLVIIKLVKYLILNVIIINYWHGECSINKW